MHSRTGYGRADESQRRFAVGLGIAICAFRQNRGRGQPGPAANHLLLVLLWCVLRPRRPGSNYQQRELGISRRNEAAVGLSIASLPKHPTLAFAGPASLVLL